MIKKSENCFSCPTYIWSHEWRFDRPHIILKFTKIIAIHIKSSSHIRQHKIPNITRLQGLNNNLSFGPIKKIILYHNVQLLHITHPNQLTQRIIPLILHIIQSINSFLPPVTTKKEKREHKNRTSNNRRIKTTSIHIFNLCSC